MNITNEHVAAFSDPAIAALREEIKVLEFEIISLEHERTDCEKVMRHFNLTMQKYVGDFLERILQIKKDQAERHRQESDYAESEYKEAKKRYEQQTQQREEAVKEEALANYLSEQDKQELKKLYRKAVVLCHPDKVAKENREEAEAIFKKLYEAYVRQDLDTVTNIYKLLQQGYFSFEIDQLTDIELLSKKKQELTIRKAAIIADIEYMKASEAWKLSHSGELLEVYFDRVKQHLEEELVKLESLYGING